ncbi:MAG: hypothetical protein IPP88_19250 [Betaproteobacteria bacterium]|nr:hypothetical protein [Betaproteobacteria bacterium]
MKINKMWMAALAIGVVVGITGCNVISFFPQKTAEKAADKVLDDILSGKGTNGNPAPADAMAPSAPAEPKQQ